MMESNIARPMMAYSRAPMQMMAANYLNVAPPMMDRMVNLTQADLLTQDMAFNINQAFERAEREIGAEFEKPGIAKEYKERHYYIKEHKDKEVENQLEDGEKSL